ncbi:MAG TPA: AAA family ATPase [Anaeromyxobacter sp.]|nr:AAA family ATPase [Anaeromyxobacter sp.]
MTDIRAEIQAVQEEVHGRTAFVEALLAETGKVVVGQRYVVERVLMGLLSGGHVLLEGVPGLAKTLAVKTIAEAVDCTFRRIQFTPDLLPADVVGTQVFDPRTQTFSARQGPVFANVVLADEVNRAPAKVQSALLEAMQERQVTLGEQTFALPDPFIVLATQNPIEQEGTYPLPEAQVDRFMLKVKVAYPTREEERLIMDRMVVAAPPHASKVVGHPELAAARGTVLRIYMDERIKEYVVDLVFATRDPRGHGLADLVPLVEYGASPRATLFLAVAARAHAFLRRRAYVTPEDVKAVAYDVLRHRITLTYEAEAEEVTPEKVISRVLDRVEVP